MKETRKQIEAQVRNKLARQYNERLKLAYESKVEAWNSYDRVCRDNQDLREENERLKEKVEQYENWIDRLQEFCNMPDDMRDKAIQKFVEETKMQKVFDTLTDRAGWFAHIFSTL